VSYPPHPEVAKQLGVPGNDKCICPNPMAAMACPFGHMLECHYPKDCEEAQCSHFIRSADPEWYPEIFYGKETELELDDQGDSEPECAVCGELLDECQCDDDDEDDDA
jgi:hypothetical protein